MKNVVGIGERRIGSDHPAYIVAEMSANHNQSLDQAVAIVKAAKEAGADAIKVQTYTPDTITFDSDGEHFCVGSGSLWEGRRLYDLYGEAYTPWEWQPALKQIASDLALDFFSSPFDETAVDFLQSFGVPAFKIASPELTDLPLIERAAKTGKPLIMSTGMATLAEIEEAVSAARQAGATEIVLLKCNSAYPSAPEDANLRTIPHLAQAFDLPVGLSDHTLGTAVPVAAVCLGACLIEKHLTLSRAVPSADSAFSLEPEEFKAMVESIRIAERALGRVQYGPTKTEEGSRAYRRSLFVVKSVPAGHTLTKQNVRSIRPACGLHPRYWDEVLGRRASRDIPAGTPLAWDLIASEG